MVEGRQRNERAIVVAQAQLVWSSAEGDELTEFILTGQWGTQSEVLPFNQDLRSAIAKEWKW